MGNAHASFYAWHDETAGLWGRGVFREGAFRRRNSHQRQPEYPLGTGNRI